jgi:chromosome partitioning protein
MTLILMRSPKGGVGTTFLTAHLATVLAERGHDVAAIDCTYQASLKLFFGLAPAQPVPTLGDSGAGGDAIAGVQLYESPDHEAGSDLADLILQRANSGIVCLVDMGSSCHTLRDRLLPHATLELCVIDPSPVALAALTRVDGEQPLLALPRTAFVLNRLDDRLRLSRDIHSLVRTLLGDQLLSTVRRDEAVNEAVAAMKPLATFAPSSAVLADIARLAEAVERRCGLGGTVLQEVAA